MSLYISAASPPYPVPQSPPLRLYANINVLPLIRSAEGHMLFLAGGPQPAELQGCARWALV